METQPVMVVNVDIAFLTNFVTDLAWLWTTAGLAGLRPRAWRLVGAAAVGAGAAVWAYFPGGRWLLSLPGALVGSAALLSLAFAPCRIRQGLRAAGYFLLTGGAMAGIVLLAGSRSPGLAGAWGAAPEFSGGVVAAGLLICLTGARYLWEAARERSRLSRGLHGFRVRMGDRSVELSALLDTGNSLKDPLSGAPVAVVEAAALDGLVPAVVLNAAAAGWDGLDRLPAAWAARCRLVPFRAVGHGSGMLLAFAPDGLDLREPKSSEWRAASGLLGLAGERLHPEGAYRALLPPALLQGANTWEGETG